MPITKKVKISIKYLNFPDIFSEKKALVLLKIANLNQYAIKLQKDQKLPYRLIYSLSLVEFDILKIYIKINLINRFIQLF